MPLFTSRKMDKIEDAEDDIVSVPLLASNMGVESGSIGLNNGHAKPNDTDEFSPSTLRTVKLVVLIVLCLQNAGAALLMRYSQAVLHEKYNATEVVLIGELMKVVFSAYYVLRTKEESNSPLGSGLMKLWWLTIHSKGIIVLVVLYSAANLLTFYALGKVEASLFSVLTQLKVCIYPITIQTHYIFSTGIKLIARCLPRLVSR